MDKLLQKLRQNMVSTERPLQPGRPVLLSFTHFYSTSLSSCPFIHHADLIIILIIFDICINLVLSATKYIFPPYKYTLGVQAPLQIFLNPQDFISTEPPDFIKLPLHRFSAGLEA